MLLTPGIVQAIDAELLELAQAQGEAVQVLMKWALTDGQTSTLPQMETDEFDTLIASVLEILGTLAPAERNNSRYRGAILNSERARRTYPEVRFLL